jgi:hypothetical protein
MFHSFPSMAIFGELTYLLFYGESTFVRLFMVAAVCLGFFIHLLLDELYSVEWDGRPHVKRSFGTAMKFVGPEWWPNFACYAKLALLTYLVMNDPSVVHQIYTGQGQEVAKSLGQTVKDQFNSAMAKTHPQSSGGTGPMGLFFGGSGSTPSAPSVPANPNTLAPPSLAWPSSSTAAPSSPAATWSVPAGSLPGAGPPSSANGTSRASPPPGSSASPADNRPWPTAPSQQTSSPRFWQ